MNEVKPKRYDLEISFMLNGQWRKMFVNVRTCRVCDGHTVFEKACPLCGRFSPHQKNAYLQCVRQNSLTSIILHEQETADILPTPKEYKENVVGIARPKDDDEPTAS